MIFSFVTIATLLEWYQVFSLEPPTNHGVSKRQYDDYDVMELTERDATDHLQSHDGDTSKITLTKSGTSEALIVNMIILEHLPNKDANTVASFTVNLGTTSKERTAEHFDGSAKSSLDSLESLYEPTVSKMVPLKKREADYASVESDSNVEEIARRMMKKRSTPEKQEPSDDTEPEMTRKKREAEYRSTESEKERKKREYPQKLSINLAGVESSLASATGAIAAVPDNVRAVSNDTVRGIVQVEKREAEYPKNLKKRQIQPEEPQERPPDDDDYYDFYDYLDYIPDQTVSRMVFMDKREAKERKKRDIPQLALLDLRYLEPDPYYSAPLPDSPQVIYYPIVYKILMNRGLENKRMKKREIQPNPLVDLSGLKSKLGSVGGAASNNFFDSLNYVTEQAVRRLMMKRKAERK